MVPKQYERIKCEVETTCQYIDNSTREGKGKQEQKPTQNALTRYLLLGW